MQNQPGQCAKQSPGNNNTINSSDAYTLKAYVDASKPRKAMPIYVNAGAPPPKTSLANSSPPRVSPHSALFVLSRVGASCLQSPSKSTQPMKGLLPAIRIGSLLASPSRASRLTNSNIDPESIFGDPRVIGPAVMPRGKPVKHYCHVPACLTPHLSRAAISLYCRICVYVALEKSISGFRRSSALH